MSEDFYVRTPQLGGTASTSSALKVRVKTSASPLSRKAATRLSSKPRGWGSAGQGMEGRKRVPAPKYSTLWVLLLEASQKNHYLLLFNKIDCYYNYDVAEQLN